MGSRVETWVLFLGVDANTSLTSTVVMDSSALCDGCRKINFRAPGFHSYDARVHLPSFFVVSRFFDEMKKNSGQCVFCRVISEVFSEWSLGQFGKQVTPDLRKVLVEVGPFAIESSEDNHGENKGILQRIQVRLSVRGKLSPELPELLSTALHFQKCSQRPPTVSELCNNESLFDWEGEESEQAYSGRIRPLVADQRLFRKWKEVCCATHGDPCNLIFTGRRPARLRLVDVEKRCVVDSEDDSSYVALSYVWGRAELPQLTRFTDERFRQAGSLDRKTLLPTIDDAVEVTRSFREKYIWVDCLCIMQDDAADKHRLIPQMDAIFGFAAVTIVAAAGVDAKAGLPGMNPGSRTREQVPFIVNGVWLLRTLDPEGPPAWSRGDWPSYLGDTVWYSRGWTFQEKLLSRKALIFTAEQVYWECQRATWREDGLWETTKSPPVYRWCFNEEFGYPWPASDVDSFETMYRKLVEEYSTRTLSYASDSLDAFAGILNAFERQTGQSFLWALPTTFLSTALTWPCDVFQGTPLMWPSMWRSDCSMERRPDCTLRASDGTTTLCPLPSWSWVGWMGEVDFDTNHDSLNSETVDLVFHILNSSGSLVQVAGRCPQTNQNEEVTSQAVTVPKESLESESHDTDTIPEPPILVWREPESKTIVTREDVPERVLTRSVASNILFFWSSAAELHLEHIGKDSYGNDEPVISSNKGKAVPGYWGHKPLFVSGHREVAEFVVIGRENSAYGNKARELFRHGLALLLVSWDSDGVAHRRGLLYVRTSDWVELDNRVWKLISLG